MKIRKLKPGTVFRFLSKPDWWENIRMDWRQHLVKTTTGWRYLDNDSVWHGEHDDLQVLGHLPADQLDAKVWKPAAETLSIGTRFRFRSFPLRWTFGSISTDSHTVFEVVNEEFTGEGQCIRATDRAGARWGTDDGVLPSDDIEIMATAEQKPTPAQPAQPQPSAIKLGLIFFFNKTPGRWDEKIPTNTLMVAIYKYNGGGRESWYFRTLSKDHTTTNGQLLNNCKEPDDITMIGQLPPDQMDATEFKEEYLTTINARPMGTGYENAAEWRDKYNETNELLTQAQERIVNIMSSKNDQFEELCELKEELQKGGTEPQLLETEPQLCTLTEIVPEPDVDSCAFFDSDGEVSQDDCGCDDCDTRIRTRLVRFFKMIW